MLLGVSLEVWQKGTRGNKSWFTRHVHHQGQKKISSGKSESPPESSGLRGDQQPSPSRQWGGVRTDTAVDDQESQVTISDKVVWFLSETGIEEPE